MKLKELKTLVDKAIKNGHGELKVTVSVGYDDLSYCAELNSLEVSYLSQDGEAISEEFCGDDEEGEKIIDLSGYMD